MGALVVLVAVQVSLAILYLPPVLKNWGRRQNSAPDDHFAAGPNCGVKNSGIGRIGGAGGRPTIGARIVSPASVEIHYCSTPPQTIISLPVHTAVWASRAVGRVGGAGGCPSVRAGIISPAGVYKGAAVKSAPHDHFATGPHCRVKLSACGRVGGADGCPGVRAGIISPAGVYKGAAVKSPHTIISLPVHTAV